MSKILPTSNLQNRALFTGQKKNKISAASLTVASGATKNAGVENARASKMQD